MQTFRIKMNYEALAGTLLGESIVLGYNSYRDFRLIWTGKPARPVTPGADERFNADEQQWKLDDITMELTSAMRLGDSASWPEPPFSPFETAVLQVADFNRRLERGVCFRLEDDCYLKSWPERPLYRAGAFAEFEQAVANLKIFNSAAQAIR